MFYEPEKRNHGLPHDPFKAIVAPRPIGWIGSYGKDGNSNLAPYSFFNAIGSAPPFVCFSSDGYKDSVANIDETGAFSCNIVSFELKDHMNKSSQSVDRSVNEFELAGLSEEKCRLVNAPFAGEAPVVLECVHLETKNIKDRHGNPSVSHLVIGEVVGIYIDESVLVDGILDVRLLRPVARMGYRDYAVADQPFEMTRPDQMK